ncbi:RhoGAP domain containing protein [Histomonas meleagridis]|uniref:RhoGAP domain containing protein n=1 Tax=Histomonas meleagridis TaxID=135588 RepID=UPI00355A3F57|nr:RhoGAP domain containing protein [Histomonas meleagridis]KAH0800696.1 RhoGAP domain containing protein [Histomonas meleagridis]
MIQVYYRYFADGSQYFFDPATSNTTYQFPTDGIVLDPTTLTPIEMDPNINPEYQIMLDQFKAFVQRQQGNIYPNGMNQITQPQETSPHQVNNNETQQNSASESQVHSPDSQPKAPPDQNQISSSQPPAPNEPIKPPEPPHPTEAIPNQTEPPTTDTAITPQTPTADSKQPPKPPETENEQISKPPETENAQPPEPPKPTEVPTNDSSEQNSTASAPTDSHLSTHPPASDDNNVPTLSKRPIPVPPKKLRSIQTMNSFATLDDSPRTPTVQARRTSNNSRHHQSARFDTLPFDGEPTKRSSRRHISSRHRSANYANLVFDGEVAHEHRRRHHHRRTRSTTLLDVPESVVNFDEKKSMQRKNSYFPDSKAPFLPCDIRDDINKFQVEEYAKQFFREHRTGHVFNRKLVSTEQITKFSKDPLSSSLIKLANQNDQKNAVKCFKLILTYIGVIKGAPNSAELIVQTLIANPSLYDEVYFQLIKQTRKNPNPEWEIRTWKLFLIITTIFPSSRNSEVWIKSHLSRKSISRHRDVAHYAQLCYIRFSSRCAIGKPKTDLGINYAVKIPQQIESENCEFGASIYEHLWFQRKKYPNFPIPIVVHQMAEAILSKNPGEMEGIFRLPGSIKNVEQMAEDYGKGICNFENAKLFDMLSLFKMWFRIIPDPTCPVDSLPYLKTAHENKDYIGFVTKHLPPAHLNLLGYLIGFLQKLVQFEAVTKMGPKNMAIVFAPNIVQPSTDFSEPGQIKEYSDISITFVTYLIENWDTKQFYPLVLTQSNTQQ